MKKFIAFLLSFAMVFCGLISSVLAADGEETSDNTRPRRIINLVYDDSGSMVYNETDKLDTWCQAKYSLEVFAAMLGEEDEMNIFYMSSYLWDGDQTIGLQLKGSDGAETNVRKVHEKVTRSGGTPFNAVKAAMENLQKKNVSNAEKWLVVLTDGEFDPDKKTGEAIDVKGYLDKKNTDINVVYLAMGMNAKPIAKDVSKHIYPYQAETSKQILQNITGICTQVFNSNKIPDTSTYWPTTDKKTFKVDVPMSQIIVFAQGEDVKITGLTDPSGKAITAYNPVTVKYSEKASLNTKVEYENPLIAKDLQGQLATFNGNFSTGDYKINVTGDVSKIEVFYTLDIKIKVFLTDESGTEVALDQAVDPGKYTIRYELVSKKDGIKVGNSALIGKDIIYAGKIVLNGTDLGSNFGNGSVINLEEGSVSVTVQATYLDYNTTKSTITCDVKKSVPLSVGVIDNPTYTLSGGGFEEKTPITIHVKKEDGSELSAEDWNGLKGCTNGGLTVTFDAPGMDCSVEVGDSIGDYKIYPQASTSGMTEADAIDQTKITFVVRGSAGLNDWKGAATGTLNVTDLRYEGFTLTVIDNPEYPLDDKGISNSNPIKVKVTMKGEELTQQQWDSIAGTQVTQISKKDSRITFVAEKTNEKGILNIYPKLVSEKVSGDQYNSMEISIVAGGDYGVGQTAGKTTTWVNIRDQRNWFIRHKKKIIIGLISLAVLILVLGYVPPFKKYLPKRLKKRPNITMRPLVPGILSKEQPPGNYTKKSWTTFIPYKPEEGKVRFLPNGVNIRNISNTLQLRAAGNNRMYVMNAARFGGKDNFAINGLPIEKDSKKKKLITAGAVVTCTGETIEYTCTLNSGR